MATSFKKMTDGEAEMLQEAKDKKAAPKIERAYNQSLTSTAPAPIERPKATPQKTPSVGEAEMLQEARDRKMASKLERAYNQSLTSTEEKKAKGGMARAKRFNDGGVASTYPFQSTGSAAPGATTTVNVNGAPAATTAPADQMFSAPIQAMKKGGSVKGWGMARGARKAKVY